MTDVTEAEGGLSPCSVDSFLGSRAKRLNALFTARALYSPQRVLRGGQRGMRVAFWSEYGRSACGVMAAAGIALAVVGCSSGVSRFNYPAFNLTDNRSSGDADMTTTSSLPVPKESVYSPERYHYYGDPQQSGGISRSTLPPPQSTAAYAPGQPRYYGTAPAAKPPAPPPSLAQGLRSPHQGPKRRHLVESLAALWRAHRAHPKRQQSCGCALA